MQLTRPGRWALQKIVFIPILTLVCLFSSPVLASIVNRTIDDGNGDSATGAKVTYFPAQPDPPWANQNCGVCAIKPDVNQAFDNTYTAATWFPQDGTMSITMQFTGTAIYVFFILVNNLGGGVSTLTLANFTLDGNAPVLFQHAADQQRSDILYNQLAFQQTNLQNTDHTLVISASSPPTSIYVNFDYAIYTHEDDTTPTTSNVVISPSSPSTPTSSPPASAGPAGTSGPASEPTSGPVSGHTSELVSGVQTTSSTSPSAVSSSANSSSSSSNSGGQVSATAASTRSSHAGAIAGVIVGVVVAFLLVAGGIFWFRRRSKTHSLEAVNQYPVKAGLPDDSEGVTSPVTSDTRSTPSRSRKFEEIDRARQLASRHPIFIPQDAESRSSQFSPDTSDHQQSMPAGHGPSLHSETGFGSISASGSRDGDAVTTNEIAQQLRQIQDQIFRLRDQRRPPSTDVILEHPPPGYQPEPPSR